VDGLIETPMANNKHGCEHRVEKNNSPKFCRIHTLSNKTGVGENRKLAMESISYVVIDEPCLRIYLNKLSCVILSTLSVLKQITFVQAN
jgi:hypothetical protein